MSLSVKSEIAGATATISVKGDVVGPDIVKVCKAIESYKNSIYEKITVDLTSVDYIDSAGLGALIYSKKIIEKNSKSIRFLTSRAVETILINCNLHKVFTIVEAQ